MLDSHRHARVFNRRVKIFARATLAMDLKPIAAEDLKVRGYGNVDVTIERVAEERTALFFNADNAHRQAAHFQCLPERILVRKKFVFDITTQHDHECGAFDLVIGDEASLGDGFVFDINHVGAVAKDLRARKLDSVLPQISAGADARAHVRARRAVIAHPLVIVPVEPFVAPVSSLKLFVVHLAGEGHAGDHEVIAAEYLADFVDYIGVETADGSSDRDHRGDADDDADESQ